jgi:hypothetical protein
MLVRWLRMNDENQSFSSCFMLEIEPLSRSLILHHSNLDICSFEGFHSATKSVRFQVSARRLSYTPSSFLGSTLLELVNSTVSLAGNNTEVQLAASSCIEALLNVQLLNWTVPDGFQNCSVVNGVGTCNPVY